jgi:hypothetical protein
MVLEASLTTIAVAASFAWPRFCANGFSRIERALRLLAQRPRLAVVTVGLSALVLRVAILPWFPVPLPFIPDDFSFLLGADTFAHGRLTNPTPAMWVHFESIHIDMLPTYMSMYFPGQALVLAAGKILLGHPWYGVLIFSAVMCASICWMLQAWLPPGWALLGGMLAVLRLGLFSYWVNTYTGGGLICATGGALILGALPRLMKTSRLRYALAMAIGIVLLVLTRPYEGMLLCLPVAFVLGRWALRGKKRPKPAILMRRAVLPLALIVAAIAWLGYYDYRNFGKPLTLPYVVNRSTYAIAPYYVWQSPRPEPEYHHVSMRDFYHDNELKAFRKFQKPLGFAEVSGFKLLGPLLFFGGFALLPPLFMMRRVFLDRRIRFLVLSVLVYMAGMVIEIFLIPHYLAPFTATFYAIGLQAMRHLRVWSAEGKPVGRMMVRMTFPLCLVLVVIRLFAGSLGFNVSEWPASNWTAMWIGPGYYGTERAQIESRLQELPGKQLAIVRYSRERNTLDQWVYNSADINDSKVIWAWEMDAANDRDLMHYYKDRKVWLVRMDTQPASVLPYPEPEQVTAVTR